MKWKQRGEGKGGRVEAKIRLLKLKNDAITLFIRTEYKKTLHTRQKYTHIMFVNTNFIDGYCLVLVSGAATCYIRMSRATFWYNCYRVNSYKSTLNVKRSISCQIRSPPGREGERGRCSELHFYILPGSEPSEPPPGRRGGCAKLHFYIRVSRAAVAHQNVRIFILQRNLKVQSTLSLAHLPQAAFHVSPYNIYQASSKMHE